MTPSKLSELVERLRQRAKQRRNWVEYMDQALVSGDAVANELEEAAAALSSTEELLRENKRLRDVLEWSQQNCPGKCSGVIHDALAARSLSRTDR